MSNKTGILVGLLLIICSTVKGQTDKKIIDDAWVYLSSWTNYIQSDTLHLVKSWDTQTICVISFENRFYSASDEFGHTKESGKWEIVKIEKRNSILIKIDGGQTIKFEILSVNKFNLKLRRVA